MIVDAHLDLAYNALHYGRDLRSYLVELRASGTGSIAGGRATVTLPELMKGGIGLVFGTLFVEPADSRSGGAEGAMVYRNADEAYRRANRQLDYYHRLADENDRIRLVGNSWELDEIVESHRGSAEPLLGIVPLMEGADPIRQPEEAEVWTERGVRIVGLAWDNTRYAAGAWRGGDQGLTREGLQLLDVMADLGLILDLTHMSETGTLTALDSYPGSIVASHSNAMALVPGGRQLSDHQIRRIGERDGVIGIVMFNGFLKPGHRRGGPKANVTLEHVAAHVDHVCQLLGDARHVGVGSDLDGGFGSDDIPQEMDSVADLHLISAKLMERGYSEADITNIMGGNWINLLRRTWV